MAGQRRQTNFRVGDFLFQQESLPEPTVAPESLELEKTDGVDAPAAPVVAPVAPPKAKGRTRASQPVAAPVESTGAAPDLVMED